MSAYQGRVPPFRRSGAGEWDGPRFHCTNCSGGDHAKCMGCDCGRCDSEESRSWPSRITLSGEGLRKIMRHAEACMPDESCAVLLGRPGSAVEVTEVVITGNAARSPVTFSIPDGELVGAHARAAGLGVEVVGIFHSHPSGVAYPSETDVGYMGSNPAGQVWAIYSGLDKDVRAFVLDSGIREVEVSISAPKSR